MSSTEQLGTESVWFRSISLIGFGFITGAFIANAIYWERILSGQCNAVSRSEANGLLWINIILAIIAGAMFIWAFIRLFFHSEPSHTQYQVPVVTPAPVAAPTMTYTNVPTTAYPNVPTMAYPSAQGGSQTFVGFDQAMRTSPTAASNVVSGPTVTTLGDFSQINQ